MDPELIAIAKHCAHEFLVWVGFGTLVGLAAKAIMPGADPGGAIVTMLMGVGGSVIGCGSLLFFFKVEKVTPISTVGFIAATGGGIMLLFFYRLLSGRIIVEAEDGERMMHDKTRRRRRRELVREA